MVLVGSLLSVHLLLEASFSPTWSIIGVTLTAILMLLGLERMIPHKKAWNGTNPHVYRVDVIHMLGTGLVAESWRALTFGIMFWCAAQLSHLGLGLWPNDWGLLPQLVLALVVGEFFQYWVHRGMHTVWALWRTHEVHHSSSMLYTLSSSRIHPLNVMLVYGSQVTPLILLGANIETLALLSVFTSIHGLLQHANIDYKHGWLNWVFATADLHRWHHSAELGESQTNFGSNLIVWDTVFGTRSLPSTEGPPEVGLEADEIPVNYFSHMAAPFR